MLSGGGLRQRSWQTRSFMSVADLSMTGRGAIIRKKAKNVPMQPRMAKMRAKRRKRIAICRMMCYNRKIPSIDKGTHGFAEHKYAHTASSPLAKRQYDLRVFPCLAAFLLRQNCAAPVGDEFSCDFWLLRRRRAGARQAEKDEKRRKDTPTGVCVLVYRRYGFPGKG